MTSSSDERNSGAGFVARDPGEVAAESGEGLGVPDAAELERHAVYIARAMRSEGAAGRRRALVDGVLRFGIRFSYGLDLLAEHMGDRGPFAALKDETDDLLARWITGERLTNQADEDERRAQMAELLLKTGSEGSERFAVRCLMALPEGHPRRDLALAREAMSRYLERSRAAGNVDDQVRAINDLLLYKIEPRERMKELIREGRALVRRVSDAEYKIKFPRNATAYYGSLPCPRPPTSAPNGTPTNSSPPSSGKASPTN